MCIVVWVGKTVEAVAGDVQKSFEKYEVLHWVVQREL